MNLINELSLNYRKDIFKKIKFFKELSFDRLDYMAHPQSYTRYNSRFY